jgi:hypothetical protein
LPNDGVVSVPRRSRAASNLESLLRRYRLFKNQTTTTRREELLVFITPRIVNERLTVR